MSDYYSDSDDSLETTTEQETEQGTETETEQETETEIENDYNNIRTSIETKSISSIYNEYLRDSRLITKPLYQRDFCWTINKMIDFIETIMRGLIVPNFVIYKLSDYEMNKTDNYDCECLDGQHRLITIKKYYENTKHENKHIYWLDENKNRVFYNMNLQELENYNKKNKQKYRNLTKSEKRKFDDFQLVIMKLETITKKELNINIKSDIFNRLQNGEKVHSHIKFRNSDKFITNYIRDNNLLSYLKDIKFQDKFLLRTKKFNESFNLYFMIRSIFIIYKKSLDTNFLDLNIKRYILENLPCAYIPDDLIPELFNKFKYFVEWITKTTILKNKIIPEFGYLLMRIYTNYDILHIEKILNILSKEEFEYFNNLSKYKRNGDKNTVTSCDTMKEKYNKIIKKNI
jgi:hypothetical protein